LVYAHVKGIAQRLCGRMKTRLKADEMIGEGNRLSY
jgi:hypothetical protein